MVSASLTARDKEGSSEGCEVKGHCRLPRIGMAGETEGTEHGVLRASIEGCPLPRASIEGCPSHGEDLAVHSEE